MIVFVVHRPAWCDGVDPNLEHLSALKKVTM